MRMGAWCTLFFAMQTTSFAGEADVLDVKVSCDSNSRCDFSVTLAHEDDGWDHYADRWEVRTLGGESLAVRTLLHPHDNEQPFTRSLKNVEIPEGVTEVVVRARDSRHKYGGKEMTVALE